MDAATTWHISSSKELFLKIIYKYIHTSSVFEREMSRIICLLSPAKSLRETAAALPDAAAFKKLRKKGMSEPVLACSETPALVKACAKLSKAKLGSMLKISGNLAAVNHDRFASFYDQKEYVALGMYNGAAYKSMKAIPDFEHKDWAFAQDCLRILSGLYGSVRPLDLIRPYRLEMGSKVESLDQSLYKYWGKKITRALLDDNPDIILNVASNEYSKSVDFQMLRDAGVLVYDIAFKEGAGGRLASVYAKQARGMLVKHVIQNKCTSLAEVQTFQGYADDYSYTFSSKQSNDTTLVFLKNSKSKKRRK